MFDFMDPRSVARVTGLVLGAGLTISTLEYLANLRQCGDDGLYSWNIWKETKFRKRPRLKSLTYPLFDVPGVVAVLLARLAMIALLAFQLWLGNPLDAVLLTALVATQFYVNFRFPVGKDGSDQMSNIVLIMLFLMAWFPGRPLIVNACTVFIAFQALASYLTSGVAKLISPYWRSGDIILGVLSTETYGSPLAASVLREHKIVRRTMNYATIAFESLIFITLLLPYPYNVYSLAVPLAFHLGCSFLMGLNVFPFAFAATFPALIYLSNHLHRIWQMLGRCY
jgi:hypothetical protein